MFHKCVFLFISGNSELTPLVNWTIQKNNTRNEGRLVFILLYHAFQKLSSSSSLTVQIFEDMFAFKYIEVDFLINVHFKINLEKKIDALL